MANMAKEKYPMHEQDPSIRNRNFEEVAYGYDKQSAMAEADRCISCKNKPCVSGCPVNVDIPAFIQKIKEDNIREAYLIIRNTNSLPAICGRVCPQESQCESRCVRAKNGESVAIGRLERFAADYCMQNNIVVMPNTLPPNGKKVAIVGSGPASLTCAGDLAKLGYEVTIFEALHRPGGVLIYGIPEFRLPKALLKQELDYLMDLGVKIMTNIVVGKTLTIDEIMEEYNAIFIGTGAGLPMFMRIPGENLNGVYSANEYLTRINLMRAYDFPKSDTPVKVGKRVAVIGGGNVAMDAARCAKRLGADKAYIIYRRGEDEMPARIEEVHHAREEGISFELLTNPTRVVGTESGWVNGIECLRMELGMPDESGRRSPVPIQGSEFILDVDTVIVAIGQRPNPLIKDTTPGLSTMHFGGIKVDEETGATSRKAIYAGGDAVTGAATVILAMGAGKIAAASIEDFLKKKSWERTYEDSW